MNRSGAVIVMSTFAAIWWAIGAAQLGQGSRSLIMAATGIVISGLLVAFDWRHGGRAASHEDRRRRGRMVGIATAVEGAAILAAVAVLGRLGRRDLIAPAVAIIVGLHFVPLARWLPAPIYYVTAVLLVAVGMAGTAVQDLHVRIVTVCIGAAGVLWLSCGMALVLRAVRRRSESTYEKV